LKPPRGRLKLFWNRLSLNRAGLFGVRLDREHTEKRYFEIPLPL
jgi:hypothetical protein